MKESDIISRYDDERVKDLIGKEVWAFDLYESESKLIKLEEIHEGLEYPFYGRAYGENIHRPYRNIIPCDETEPKLGGDEMKIDMKEAIWNPNDERVLDLAGKKVLAFDNWNEKRSISVLEYVNEESCFPFNCKSLTERVSDGEPVRLSYRFIAPYEEQEPEYIPFDLSCEDDRKRLMGAWVKNKKNSVYHQVVSIDAVLSRIELGSSVELFPQHLLEYYVMVDGSPCGKMRSET